MSSRNNPQSSRRSFVQALGAALPAAGSVLQGAQASAGRFIENVTFEERPALLLSNDKLQLTVLKTGGAMADLILSDDAEKLSPMWNRTRMERESGQKPSPGFSIGHFVCVDGFGPVSQEERGAGMPGHGEAHTLPWEMRYSGKEGRTATASFTVRLPLVQETFTRTLRMVDGENVVYVESELENLLAFDRPVCWAEHATIGSPFLEPGVTVVDMSARRARVRPYPAKPGPMVRRLKSAADFTWPTAPGASGGKIDLRAAVLNAMGHTTCLMDPSRKQVFVTALHPGKGLVLGYVFHREEFPWLQSWENYPPTGKLARGLEFSTQPFDVSRREAVQTGTMFDTPTYRWLPAKSKIGARFLMFYARTPEGMNRVDDVRHEGGQLIVEDRKARKQITLAASLPL
ncbi:MAG: hypothetical protein WD696_21220 [Bryobacteraceae bacterium]